MEPLTQDDERHGRQPQLNKQMRKMMKEGDMDIDPSSSACECTPLGHGIFDLSHHYEFSFRQSKSSMASWWSASAKT